jgi:hypothetical protein
MSAPVLFCIFNRPETTGRVFEVIRQARPERLYIAADGPRPHKPGEDALCAQTRLVAQQVDWPCEVHTLFRRNNLGCSRAVSGAVSWFFTRESEGIILEDDVLPHPDFFAFCAVLLEKYRNAPEVMLVSGNNFQLGLKRGEASYYFSAFSHIWGWASWARAWKFFDLAMPGLDRFVRSPGLWPADVPELRYLWQLMQAAAAGRIDTWDCALSYALMRHKGLCAIPEHNLARNIGFGGGTNCLVDSIWNYAQTRAMPRITHPAEIKADREADNLTARICWSPAKVQAEAILAEAFRRLGRGEARSNFELLDMARKFYKGVYVLDFLEVLTLAHLGEDEAALGKTEALARAYPAEAQAAGLWPRVRAVLRKQPGKQPARQTAGA